MESQLDSFEVMVCLDLGCLHIVGQHCQWFGSIHESDARGVIADVVWCNDWDWLLLVICEVVSWDFKQVKR